MRSSALFVTALLPLVAVGCSGPRQSTGPGFGDSYHQNMAVQVIDPMPAHADDGAPDMNGNRAALAIQRYETNKVIQPRTARTGSVLSGGSGSGGGGGGGSQ